MSLRAAVRRTLVSKLVRAEWSRAPVKVCTKDDVVARLTEVRVQYVVDPDEDERPTCKFCKIVIRGERCAADTQCNYHFYCAALVLHQSEERFHEKRQRRCA